ncbi:hybrid sensor histidine kinase/response regulator [Croceicoccus bisphenolivorans]|uniref:hybrid sensor histidine kinase/response regulator n=1 Tax=Croceicoccus bisphenolivorans TaxID=1783232 RepID=UPI0008349EC7|nr:ATP-binding protein [Croceicoccus bisphenolivorans]
MAGADPAAQSGDLLAEVIDALPGGLAIFDADARLLRANATFRTLNSALGDLIVPGLEWDRFLVELVARGCVAPSIRERLQWMEGRLGDGERPAPPFTFEMRGGGLHEVALRQTATGGFILTQADVTDSRRAEENEREADAVLRHVLDSCPANLVMSRVDDAQVIYRSPAARELFGSGRDAAAHFASRAERADFITALLPQGRVDEMVVDGVRPDGGTFPCLISARLIEYRGEDVVISAMVDISGEVAMRKTLAEQRERIFQAEKMSALGELLAGVAHELNNPLSVVVGHALMMREEASDPDTIRRIEKIGNAAERCTKIVKSFLAMARRQNVDAAAIAPAQLVKGAIDTLQQGSGPMRATVGIDLPETLPALLGDAAQLEQVFMNLLLNAEQAMREREMPGTIRISARPVAGQPALAIDVEDDGPGIPAEIGQRVFEPLFTTKRAGEGTGIGLAFCHRVVTTHGGTIELLPSETGAHFRVTLPTGDAPASARSVTQGATQAPAAARILVIDDEEDVADLVSEILKKEGLSVDAAHTAEDGIAMARKADYAAILTDLNMPGMGGRGLYDVLRAESPALAHRIAFVTGDTMSPDVRDFLDKAGRPFLEKPIAPKDLRALVSGMLAND